MLVVAAADGCGLDAGSLGLALARRWSQAGEHVLFVDADVAGSRLAQRFGAVDHAHYSPALRGLPSLIVARQRLTLRLLADHCYSLDTSTGSLWALFAPDHPAGGKHAARWLADRCDELAAVDAERRVIMSASLPEGAQLLLPVLHSGAVLAVVAPVPTAEEAKGLWRLCRELELSRQRCRHRVLIAAGDSAVSDDDIGTDAGMHFAGRLPVVDDDKVLRPHSGRRERALAAGIDKIADRLLAYTRQVDAQSSVAGAAAVSSEAAPAGSPQPRPAGVNGAEMTPDQLLAAQPAEHSEGKV